MPLSLSYPQLSKISHDIEANKLCPAPVMQIGLNSYKVQILDRLVDLKTGTPLGNKFLSAWTEYGVIQLLDSAWQLDKDDKLITNASVYSLILHEIYRTTNCDDDNSAISTPVLKLLKDELIPKQYICSVDKNQTRFCKRQVTPRCDASMAGFHFCENIYCAEYGLNPAEWLVKLVDTDGNVYSGGRYSDPGSANNQVQHLIDIKVCK